MKHFGNVSYTTLESREKLHNPLCKMAEYKDIARGAERNQTSLRRDCDCLNISHLTYSFERNQTSLRRDCDTFLLDVHSLHHTERNQTSLRRDCDAGNSKVVRLLHRKKSDLIKKGLRLIFISIIFIFLLKEIRPH